MWRGGVPMTNRLGYETIHTMVNLRRQWKLKIKEEHINASKLINDLLTKHWQYEHCHTCYSPHFHTYDCAHCGALVVICDESDICPPTRQCKCDYPYKRAD